MTEIIAPRAGIGTLSLVMPALTRLGRADRWLAWIDPPYIPYAPALTGRGIEPRLHLIRFLGVLAPNAKVACRNCPERAGQCECLLS
ncbi:MAG: hypothetical protein ACREYE_14005 [Gammaproteobacteria bacterium]